MKTLKKLLTLLLLCNLPTWAFCQPLFTATEATLNQTVTQILGIYGNQTNLSAAQIEAALFPFVQGSVPAGNCPPPIPQIVQSGNGGITFSWAPINQANSYGTYYLNLVTGATNSGTTNVPGVSYASLTGLHLFGFHSICGEGEKGPSTIIIVDVEVLFPEDDQISCNCSTPQPVVLSGDYPNLSTPWAWASRCNKTRYHVEVAGVIFEDDAMEFYNSSLSFIHDLENSSITLLPQCNENAISSANNPLSVGSGPDPNVYNLSFSNSGLLVNFPIAPEEFSLYALNLTNCGCEGKKGNSNNIQGEIIKLSNAPFMAMPNPSSHHTQLQYTLEEDAETQIVIYDTRGRVIKEVLNPGQQAAGFYQLDLDISNWPAGIYYCQLSTNTFTRTIKLKKG